MKIVKSLLPLTMLLLSGCVVGPDYQAPDTALPGKFSEAAGKSAGDTTLDPWWENFRDKRLNELVSRGMNENLDVLQSLERISEAQANVILAGAGGLPQINAGGNATASGQDGSLLQRQSGVWHTQSKDLAGSAGASWLLDFFGQYRRARESANASLDAAYDNVNVARLAYLNELTTTYISARFFQEALALNRLNLQSRRETLKLTQDIRAAGAASSLDVVQAEGLVNQTLAEIPPLETGFYQSANRAATLLGVPAATITPQLIKAGPQPTPRHSTRVGVPADLIRNRPDIRAAERNLAAATAQIGVAESQLYPSLTLDGTIGAARTISAITGNVTSWSFGPTLTVPIFNGGALRAQVDIADSVAKQQYFAWKQTVLNAVEEVENAQTALIRDYQTVAALRRLVASNEEALSLARESYRGGASTILDVLDAERNVANSRLTLASSIRSLANDYVSLNVAIGGGSAIETPVPTPAPGRKVAATQ
ncbi:efflux transporter outer membrane subunit [Rhizobium sp. TRM96647]|uniref:efflux transporter outer membrane subunit n=1 Tax=unclassified Rhizobium TaxID=2613769 RepID=UPI001E4706AA|nr:MULTISPECIES: efflux transporter outer membrane subunit [unclassified Rhizobium]MCD2183223.1 efflux transporter outer membrane subunit [Rhizobium sp. GN54]MCV3735814.1 efflux transporter outer membrane subunit [Rhizobium sp. TRM96647]MCV3758524.1 efflux transporter outer membrane subunit [Rhizobium sp. TRM96650]